MIIAVEAGAACRRRHPRGYQVFGEGVDLVFVPGCVSHIDNYRDEPK